MSHYSGGIARRNFMYPYGMKHGQVWTDDRRPGESRRREMDRVRLDGGVGSLHDPAPPSHTYMSSNRRSGFVNTINPDVRLNRSAHVTLHDSPSSWIADMPVHTPEWRSQYLPAEQGPLESRSPNFHNVTSDRRPLSSHFDIPRHLQGPSFVSSHPQYRQTGDMDDQGYERSPPPPYTSDPTPMTNYSPRQHIQTGRVRQPRSSPSQMQMVRYDPNSSAHNTQETTRSSSYAETGPNMHRSSNWSTSPNRGSIGQPSPQPYRSEYTRFSPSFSSAQAPYGANHYNTSVYQTYREAPSDMYEEDDGDFMSDGVASDEGEYYSSDGGHLEELGENEFEVFSDDGYSSPIDDFYGDD